MFLSVCLSVCLSASCLAVCCLFLFYMHVVDIFVSIKTAITCKTIDTPQPHMCSHRANVTSPNKYHLILSQLLAGPGRVVAGGCWWLMLVVRRVTLQQSVEHQLAQHVIASRAQMQPVWTPERTVLIGEGKLCLRRLHIHVCMRIIMMRMMTRHEAVPVFIEMYSITSTACHLQHATATHTTIAELS